MDIDLNLKTNNMEKEFIPYEQALALRKLGFNEQCIATIDQSEYFHIKGTKNKPRGSMLYDTIDLPLYQQAFRWFREKCNYSHSISKTYGGEYIPYANGSELNWNDERFQWIYKTYEEAELACLKKLIEIVNG